jgi:hypothetical protein
MYQLTQLRALDLSMTTVDTPGFSDPFRQGNLFLLSVLSCLRELRSLDLSGCGSWIATANLQRLSGLSQLRQLRLEHIRAVPPHLFLLRQLPVTAIHVVVNCGGGVAFASEWLQAASEMLEALHLTLELNIGDAVVVQLLSNLSSSAAPGLRELCLSGFTMLGAQATLLSGMTKLTSLALLRCGMHDAAVCHLSSLANLRSLSLEQNPEVLGNEGSMACLATGLAQLTSLGLGGTSAAAAAQVAFGPRFQASVGSDDVFVLLSKDEVEEQTRQHVQKLQL